MDSVGDGFDSLYDRYAHRALRLAGLVSGHRERAEDAVAEAFVRVLPRWQNGAVDDFWPYLRTAVVNELRGGARRDASSRRWQRRTTPLLVDGVAPEIAVVERARVAAALDALPPRQRLAVVLRYFEDVSEVEAARLMGCSVGTVKSTTSRAAARLRELLDDERGGDR